MFIHCYHLLVLYVLCLMFAVWQCHLLKILPVIICYETLHTHSELWPMVWVSKRCVITQYQRHHSNWKVKKKEKPKLTHYVASLCGSKAWNQCEVVRVSMWTGTEHVAAGRSAAACCCGRLAGTCPDEMSCLFMKVSLRGLTLFSLLPLCIRLLFRWLTHPAQPDYLCAFKKHKYNVIAPLFSHFRDKGIHKSIAMTLWVLVTCECCLLQS